jgi:hypothetical protein
MCDGDSHYNAWVAVDAKRLGRCVRKMDHYCPWAGGIIGESTHKFFMQFVAYAALYISRNCFTSLPLMRQGA